MTLGVTGSTGALGALVIRALSGRVPPGSIVALARSEERAAGLKAAGVQVRLAAYEDRPALERALAGVDRLLLISGSEPGKRFPQHKNAVDAAKAAGVGLIAYTSIAHADTSANPLAPEHKATEEYIRGSGLPFVFLRNNWYTENYFEDARRAAVTGSIEAAAGSGRVASASRADYAQAAAAVLAGEGHEARVYELCGEPAWSYAELARTIGELAGRKVAYVEQTAAERKNALLKAGLPEGVADFVVSLDRSIAAGSLDEAGGDLRALLGRPPASLKEVLKAALA